MAGHTPGPWRVVGADTDWVGVQMGRDGGFSISGHNSHANARLIAAAPDLYEVLQRCAELLDDYSDVNDGEDGQPVANRAMSLLRDVEAAIAKAEGTK